jgi:phosphonate transport system substrate-binding protein
VIHVKNLGENSIMTHFKFIIIILTSFLLFSTIGCNQPPTTLYVGGIPDQDTARLARRYEQFVVYLSEELKIPVAFKASMDYSAVVTAFSQGDIDLGFFGGLTGVQARIQNPGAQAIAQREDDAIFLSKFIANPSLNITSIKELKKNSKSLTITFGSESSTSGNLMPRHFLLENGIDPDKDFKTAPNYSGSHDLTWKLVHDGAFDIGALNSKVWDRTVNENTVDKNRVTEFYTTPPYYDYNWTVRHDIDAKFGDGFTLQIQQALLKLNTKDHKEILDLFNANKFIPTTNSNYLAIKDIAESLGIIK